MLEECHYVYILVFSKAVATDVLEQEEKNVT
jgi:hypothetical protein